MTGQLYRYTASSPLCFSQQSTHTKYRLRLPTSVVPCYFDSWSNRLSLAHSYLFTFHYFYARHRRLSVFIFHAATVMQSTDLQACLTEALAHSPEAFLVRYCLYNGFLYLFHELHTLALHNSVDSTTGNSWFQ
jgi:hypothetical protein